MATNIDQHTRKPHYREIEGGFWSAFFEGLSPAFPLWPTGRFEPPRYPADSRQSDLERIAHDMYAAMVNFGVEAEP